jgi:hypothetical protein
MATEFPGVAILLLNYCPAVLAVALAISTDFVYFKKQHSDNKDFTGT